MGSNITLVAFGTFGNPNGFRQTLLSANKQKQAEEHKELMRHIRTFDLNTNAIRVFPGSTVYSMRKETAGAQHVVSYTAYSFAKEQYSERSGTFIGSGILFTGKIAEENITIRMLNELQQALIAKNVQQDVLIVDHSDKLAVSRPRDLDKTEYHLKAFDDLNSGTSGQYLVVYCKTTPHELQGYFRKAIDLLNVYDTIYFSQSKEVATYVSQKGIFKLVEDTGFEQEMEKWREQKRKETEAAIARLEEQLRALDTGQLQTIQELKEKIELQEQTHQENERKIKERKGEMERVRQYYADFSTKVRELLQQLRSGKKLGEVRRTFDENEKQFKERIRSAGIFPPLATIAATGFTSSDTSRTPQQHGHQKQRHGDDYYHRKKRTEEESFRMNYYKLTTFIFLFLLLASCGINIYLFWKYREPAQPPVKESVATSDYSAPPTQSPSPPVDTSARLNPESDTMLSQKEYRLMARSLAYGMKLEDVVDTIFKMNPVDIRSRYEGQEKAYGVLLKAKNVSCFKDSNGFILFTADTLRYIPSVKKKP